MSKMHSKPKPVPLPSHFVVGSTTQRGKALPVFQLLETIARSAETVPTSWPNSNAPAQGQPASVPLVLGLRVVPAVDWLHSQALSKSNKIP